MLNFLFVNADRQFLLKAFVIKMFFLSLLNASLKCPWMVCTAERNIKRGGGRERERDLKISGFPLLFHLWMRLRFLTSDQFKVFPPRSTNNFVYQHLRTVVCHRCIYKQAKRWRKHMSTIFDDGCAV